MRLQTRALELWKEVMNEAHAVSQGGSVEINPPKKTHTKQQQQQQQQKHTHKNPTTNKQTNKQTKTTKNKQKTKQTKKHRCLKTEVPTVGRSHAGVLCKKHNKGVQKWTLTEVTQMKIDCRPGHKRYAILGGSSPANTAPKLSSKSSRQSHSLDSGQLACYSIVRFNFSVSV